MSREAIISNLKYNLVRQRLLITSWDSGDTTVTVDGLNDNYPIDLDEMDNNDIHTKWVSPVIANFIEEVVKSTTFNTTVTGTYESDVLNVTETLTSTENNYGS